MDAMEFGKKIDNKGRDYETSNQVGGHLQHIPVRVDQGDQRKWRRVVPYDTPKPSQKENQQAIQKRYEEKVTDFRIDDR